MKENKHEQQSSIFIKGLSGPRPKRTVGIFNQNPIFHFNKNSQQLLNTVAGFVGTAPVFFYIFFIFTCTYICTIIFHRSDEWIMAVPREKLDKVYISLNGGIAGGEKKNDDV